MEGIPDSFHEQVSYCFVMFLEPGRGRLAPWGIRRGFSVAPLNPLCCWLGRPHLLGNKSEAKKSNLGVNQIKENSRNCAHTGRCNKEDYWKKGGMREGQARMLPSLLIQPRT